LCPRILVGICVEKHDLHSAEPLIHGHNARDAVPEDAPYWYQGW
jgi:hypothetical protein